MRDRYQGPRLSNFSIDQSSADMVALTWPLYTVPVRSARSIWTGPYALSIVLRYYIVEKPVKRHLYPFGQCRVH